MKFYRNVPAVVLLEPYLVNLYQKSPKKIALDSNLDLPWGVHKFYMELYRENFRNLPVLSH